MKMPKITRIDLEKTYKINIDPNYDAFKALTNSTKNIRNKYAAYKTLHYIVYARNRLYHMKVVESPLCQSCDIIEDKDHMLFKCEKIKKLWENVIAYLREYTNINIQNLK